MSPEQILALLALFADLRQNVGVLSAQLEEKDRRIAELESEMLDARLEET